MAKKLILKEDIAIINIHIPNKRTLKYMKQTLTN